MLPPIPERLATDLSCRPMQVVAAVELLDGGATVPFVARYRKEATGGLDDTQLRTLTERLTYLRELEARRTAILSSVKDQGRLTPVLKEQIENADSKQRLEDLYLPYKTKRRTRAQIAREAGLAPLAETLLGHPQVNPEAEASKYLNPEKGVGTVQDALDGARQILTELMAENAELSGKLRQLVAEQGVMVAKVESGKETEGAKFRDYFDYSEPMARVPSHRALALFRGRNEKVLRLALELEEELRDGGLPSGTPTSAERLIAVEFGIHDQGRPADRWLLDAVHWAWATKLSMHLELEAMTSLRERAEAEAIRVFAKNLHDLLLAAPAGPRATMGLDPGLRTGVKVAVVDATGKLLDTATIYPHPPKNDWQGAIVTIARLAEKHRVELLSIGNGTASRETERLALEVVKKFPQLTLTKVMVSEAGASVYSASALAAKEMPDQDVSLRGAVSIARRLQDPLAELVKIEPKSIGVGQYQHDVNQTQLSQSLDAVVEDCVNAVGVDVNTASPSLLSRVSGVNATLAGNIVTFRDEHGPFRSRKALGKVPRFGAKAFEQAAGFLRVNDGEDPLDASAVHPEAYPVVKRILAGLKKELKEVIGATGLLRGQDPKQYIDATFGLPTVQDILRELEKPGRDPRPEFKTAAFMEGVESLNDLKPGMILEGAVTNVTNFGAFVDIGVHQDGLVHISALSTRFVKDPREIVKAGDIVRVKVLEIDLARQRVALTMRLEDRLVGEGQAGDGEPRPAASRRREPAPAPRPAAPPASGIMAAAFAKLQQKKQPIGG